jgi:hypothetical protein
MADLNNHPNGTAVNLLTSSTGKHPNTFGARQLLATMLRLLNKGLKVCSGGIHNALSTLTARIEREKRVIEQLHSVVEPITTRTLGELSLIHVSYATTTISHFIQTNMFSSSTFLCCNRCYGQEHTINDANDVRVKINFFVPGYPHRDQVRPLGCSLSLSLLWLYVCLVFHSHSHSLSLTLTLSQIVSGLLLLFCG